MTTSLAYRANNAISLLVDPVNQPTVTHVYRGHPFICPLAQQIPTSAASRTSSCATAASSAAADQTPTFLAT
jgi:hypothetical protein